MVQKLIGLLLLVLVSSTVIDAQGRYIVANGTVPCEADGDKRCASCKSVGTCFTADIDGLFYLEDTVPCTTGQACQNDVTSGAGSCVDESLVTSCTCVGVASGTYVDDPYSSGQEGGSYHICNDAAADVYETCEPTEVPSSTAPYCVDTVCPTSPCPSYYLDPGNDGCTTYYFCNAQGFFPTECRDEGTCFINVAGTCTCDVPSFGCPDCGYKPAANSTNPGDYVICNEGVDINTTCPSTEPIFNADLCKCTVATTLAPPPTENPNCVDDCGFYPDATDCSIFYDCLTNVPVQDGCLGSGNCYHEEACDCIECPACHFKPDPLNPTTGYVDCHYGFDLPSNECSSGLLYDPVSCECVESLPTTVGAETTTVAGATGTTTSGSGTGTTGSVTGTTGSGTVTTGSGTGTTGSGAGTTGSGTGTTGGDTCPACGNTPIDGASGCKNSYVNCASTEPVELQCLNKEDCYDSALCYCVPAGSFSTTEPASCPACGRKPKPGATGCENSYIYCEVGDSTSINCLNDGECFQESTCFCVPASQFSTPSPTPSTQDCADSCGSVADPDDPHQYCVCKPDNTCIPDQSCGERYFDPSTCTCVVNPPSETTAAAITTTASPTTTAEATTPEAATPEATTPEATTMEAPSTTPLVPEACSDPNCKYYPNYATQDCKDYLVYNCDTVPGQLIGSGDCPVDTCYDQAQCGCVVSNTN